jgi:hypothetical protein
MLKATDTQGATRPGREKGLLGLLAHGSIRIAQRRSRARSSVDRGRRRGNLRLGEGGEGVPARDDLSGNRTDDGSARTNNQSLHRTNSWPHRKAQPSFSPENVTPSHGPHQSEQSRGNRDDGNSHGHERSTHSRVGLDDVLHCPNRSPQSEWKAEATTLTLPTDLRSHLVTHQLSGMDHAAHHEEGDDTSASSAIHELHSRVQAQSHIATHLRQALQQMADEIESLREEAKQATMLKADNARLEEVSWALEGRRAAPNQLVQMLRNSHEREAALRGQVEALREEAASMRAQQDVVHHDDRSRARAVLNTATAANEAYHTLISLIPPLIHAAEDASRTRRADDTPTARSVLESARYCTMAQPPTAIAALVDATTTDSATADVWATATDTLASDIKAATKTEQWVSSAVSTLNELATAVATGIRLREEQGDALATMNEALRMRCEQAEASAAAATQRLEAAHSSLAKLTGRTEELEAMQTEQDELVQSMRREGEDVATAVQRMQATTERLKEALRDAVEENAELQRTRREDHERIEELDSELKRTMVALLRAKNARSKEILERTSHFEELSKSLSEELRETKKALLSSPLQPGKASFGGVERALHRDNERLVAELAVRDKTIRDLKRRIQDLAAVDVYRSTISSLVSPAAQRSVL